jgi:transcriptional regulator with XRE-family HTH domain
VQEIQRNLGSKIRTLRIEKGYSQESFADACKLHRTYMGSLERGERNLTLKTLMTVAQALGMTVAELLKGIV